MSTFTFLHYSEQPLTAVRDAESIGDQTWGEHTKPDKPEGLWLSVEGEDDWPSYCRYNWPSWRDDVKHATEVVLLTANLLVVDTEAKLLALSKRFPRDGRSGSVLESFFRAPCWYSIAAIYDGIVIAPYQWSCRLDSDAQWYYGWDAASACVWRARAVDRLIDRPEKLAAFDVVDEEATA